MSKGVSLLDNANPGEEGLSDGEATLRLQMPSAEDATAMAGSRSKNTVHRRVSQSSIIGLPANPDHEYLCSAHTVALRHHIALITPPESFVGLLVHSAAADLEFAYILKHVS
jgi:hypothetical protein